MSLENKIINELKFHGADFIHFVDISHLLPSENNGYRNAILFGISLSPAYIREVIDTPDYVSARIKNNFDFDDDEYYIKELKADGLSDLMAEYLKQKGYSAYSQSDKNQLANNSFDAEHIRTILPHKTIALLAGIGWIGKNNLLVTPEYGSAICVGCVLTDAPLKTVSHTSALPKCHNCNICENACEPQALKGYLWRTNTPRENIIDIHKCVTCLKCMVMCPWTQAYMKRGV